MRAAQRQAQQAQEEVERLKKKLLAVEAERFSGTSSLSVCVCRLLCISLIRAYRFYGSHAAAETTPESEVEAALYAIVPDRIEARQKFIRILLSDIGSVLSFCVRLCLYLSCMRLYLWVCISIPLSLTMCLWLCQCLCLCLWL